MVKNSFPELSKQEGLKLLADSAYVDSMMNRLNCSFLNRKTASYNGYNFNEFEVEVNSKNGNKIAGRLLVVPRDEKMFYILFMAIDKSFLSSISGEIDSILQSFSLLEGT